MKRVYQDDIFTITFDEPWFPEKEPEAQRLRVLEDLGEVEDLIEVEEGVFESTKVHKYKVEKVMTEKEIIKAEIERQKHQWKLCHSSEAKYRLEMLEDISSFIDSMQEEEFNITGIKSKHAEGKLKECIESITEESLTKARKQLEEESASEELSSYADEYAAYTMQMMTVAGEDDDNSIEEYIKQACIDAANWQKQHMMKEAVEAHAIPCDNEFLCDFSKIPYFDNWEKVKLIIVKEE